MLQAIRDRAQGWIAWAIVLLISVPFALWGIQEYLGIGGEPVVAKVGGRDISQRELDENFQRYKMALRERLGAAYNASMVDDAKVREQVLDAMIRSDVILQAGIGKGMRAGDNLIRQTIAGMQKFQSGGRFDREAYEQNLRLQGLSPGAFEQQVRSAIVSEQISAGIQGSSFLTARDLGELQRLQGQKRELSYLVFPDKDFRPAQPPSEEDISAYYRAHPKDFTAPEQVKLAYLDLDAKQLAVTAQVSDDELKSYFDEHRDEFVTPEQRRARHILIPLAENANAEAVAAAEKKATEVEARLKAGESFESLAKALSGDPGSAARGGDLGWFERGVMDPAFENAVFSMKPDQVSAPIRTHFGLHIIQLVGVRPGGKADLAAVRDKVEAAVRASKGEHLFYDDSERLANVSYEHPDSLEPAAKALGLKIQTSDWIGRSGGPGPLSNPKVTAAAFSDDVLVQRYNSEPIELGQEHVLVLRVVDHQDAHVKPLDAVRSEIAETLAQQRGAEQARKAGEAVLARLRGGAAIDAEATAVGRKLNRPGLVGRDATDVPPAVLADAFKLPKPAAGKTSYGEASLSGGDFAVVAVSGVQDGAVQSGEAARQEPEILAAARARADGIFRSYVDYAKSQTKIEITAKPR